MKYYIVYKEANGRLVSRRRTIYEGWNDAENCPRGCRNFPGHTLKAFPTREAAAAALRQLDLMGSASRAEAGRQLSDLESWERTFDLWSGKKDRATYPKVKSVRESSGGPANRIALHLFVESDYAGALAFKANGLLQGTTTAPTGVASIVQIDLAMSIAANNPGFGSRRRPASALPAFQGMRDFAMVQQKRAGTDCLIYVDGAFESEPARKAGYGFIAFKNTGGRFLPHYCQYGPLTDAGFPTGKTAASAMRDPAVATPAPGAAGGTRAANYFTGQSAGAELAAFVKVCQWIKAAGENPERCVICYDNTQAALQVNRIYAAPSPKSSPSVRQFHSDLDALGYGDIAFRVGWLWTSSHKGEFGNELVDQLANRGLEASSIVEKKDLSQWSTLAVLRGQSLPVCHGRQYFEIAPDGHCYGALLGLKFAPIHPDVEIRGFLKPAGPATVPNGWEALIDAL